MLVVGGWGDRGSSSTPESIRCRFIIGLAMGGRPSGKARACDAAEGRRRVQFDRLAWLRLGGGRS